MAKPLLDPQTTGYLHRYSCLLLWIKVFTPKLVQKNIKTGFVQSIGQISPYYLFFGLVVFFRLLTIGNDLTVGEDIGPQVLSTTQWVEEKSVAPNFIVSPDISDLSLDKQTWISEATG